MHKSVETKKKSSIVEYIAIVSRLALTISKEVTPERPDEATERQTPHILQPIDAHHIQSVRHDNQYTNSSLVHPLRNVGPALRQTLLKYAFPLSMRTHLLVTVPFRLDNWTSQSFETPTCQDGTCVCMFGAVLLKQNLLEGS